MRNQIQQLTLLSLMRIVGRYLLTLAFALSIIVNAGAAQDRQTSPAKKTKQPAQTLSGSEISEARELLDQLGYWVNLEATGNVRHALIAFQKIEGRERTGVLTTEELEALRVAQMPQALETGYPHIEVDLHRQVLFVVDVAGVLLRILPISSGSGEFLPKAARRDRPSPRRAGLRSIARSKAGEKARSDCSITRITSMAAWPSTAVRRFQPNPPVTAAFASRCSHRGSSMKSRPSAWS